MTTTNQTNDNLNKLDPDEELVVKTNNILKFLEENEFENDKYFILPELYNASSAFVRACINEMKENKHDTPEKQKARIDLEARIKVFEEFMEFETFVKIQDYFSSRIN